MRIFSISSSLNPLIIYTRKSDCSPQLPNQIQPIYQGNVGLLLRPLCTLESHLWLTRISRSCPCLVDKTELLRVINKLMINKSFKHALEVNFPLTACFPCLANRVFDAISDYLVFWVLLYTFFRCLYRWLIKDESRLLPVTSPRDWSCYSNSPAWKK